MINNRFERAWENAPILNNRNPNQYRMCYICKRIMNHGNRWKSETDPIDGVNIDHINGDRGDNWGGNLAAVHYDCNVEKGNNDLTHLYNTVMNEEWIAN